MYIVSIYLSFLYIQIPSFDYIHLSAVCARAINKSNHLSHSNFSRDGPQVSFCTFVLFTLWHVDFFLLSKPLHLSYLSDFISISKQNIEYYLYP